MLKNALLGLAALVAALLVGEAALALLDHFPPSPRLYPGDRPVGTYEHEDPWIGWKLPPGTEIRSAPSHGDFEITYRANRLGFRAGPWDDALAADASAGDPGARRIVFLGDSFTFGVGVEPEETLVHRVGRALPGAVALNFGMSGFGIDQMWLTLRHYAAPTEPDLVVLSFVLDDLDRTMAAYRLRDTLEFRRSRGEIGWVPKPAFSIGDDGRLVRLDASHRPPAPLRFLRRHSRILEGWTQVVDRLGERFPIGERWRLNRRIFREIRDEARRLGAPLLVVYLPARGLAERETPLFEREFQALGIPYLDLRARLPADPAALYFEHDAHFNAAGHAFAARHILRTLEELGWTE